MKGLKSVIGGIMVMGVWVGAADKVRRYRQRVR